MAKAVAEHFEDLEQQSEAARLGMWIFLGTELLLFAGLFVFYAIARVDHPEGFGAGVAHNTRLLGSLNAVILLTSSFTVAMAVHSLRARLPRASAAYLGGTLLLASLFVVVKMIEYRSHIREGILPGGFGAYFTERSDPGLVAFFSLYYLMTGLHLIHVLIGMTVLAVLGVRVMRGAIAPPATYPLELGALYWHLVDLVWIFLWPLLYLTPGAAP